MAEKYRHINFSRAKRGPVIKPEAGKTKISIRLDNTVLEHFRALADKAGGGSYQTRINDAPVEFQPRGAREPGTLPGGTASCRTLIESFGRATPPFQGLRG